jgi:membrane fusion protein (multidrug efflux system)
VVPAGLPAGRDDRKALAGVQREGLSDANANPIFRFRRWTVRMPALLLTALVLALLIAPAHGQDGPPAAGGGAAQPPSAKTKELQKERIAVLKTLVTLQDKLFQSGRGPFDSVLQARTQLFEAELDAAESQADRLTLCQNLVDTLKAYETTASERVKAARETEAAVLAIRARRLEAELRLERMKTRPTNSKRQSFTVTAPKVRDAIVTQKYVCKILAQRHIKVRSLETGYLEEVPVKEGQSVKQGDVLFRIVPNLYKAKLDAVVAEVKLAELELKNTEKLFKDNLVSVNEVAHSQAKLAGVRARAKVAETELQFTTVRAPFDGTIGRLHELQGSLITEREVLATLSDTAGVWVYFDVPQARFLEYAARPAAEKDEKIELVLADGSKFKYAGKIAAVEAQADSDNGTIAFRADFPNPDGLLRHGMTGTVLIHRTLKNALLVPQRATFEVADKRYVYVVDAGGVVRQREIVIRNEVGDSFAITRGVGPEDRILLDGIREVHDGEKLETELLPAGETRPRDNPAE